MVKKTKKNKPKTSPGTKNKTKHPQNQMARTFMEIVERKPRQEEEKFFFVFSKTQLSAVTVMLLASTFLVQGIMQFLEYIGKIEFIKPWFAVIVSSILFLTLSVVLITLDGVIKPIKIKTKINVAAFVTYLVGFLIFLASVVLLLFTIIF
jgi:hypothetical protein